MKRLLLATLLTAMLIILPVQSDPFDCESCQYAIEQMILEHAPGCKTPACACALAEAAFDYCTSRCFKPSGSTCDFCEDVALMVIAACT